jgi:hypothetical protein
MVGEAHSYLPLALPLSCKAAGLGRDRHHEMVDSTERPFATARPLNVAAGCTVVIEGEPGDGCYHGNRPIGAALRARDGEVLFWHWYQGRL